jgi:hypothetical protein
MRFFIGLIGFIFSSVVLASAYNLENYSNYKSLKRSRGAVLFDLNKRDVPRYKRMQLTHRLNSLNSQIRAIEKQKRQDNKHSGNAFILK